MFIFKKLTEGWSPLTFVSCLFCNPEFGERGSETPPGPPLPPAGDLLPGLPVVLKKIQTANIYYLIITNINYLFLSPYQ